MTSEQRHIEDHEIRLLVRIQPLGKLRSYAHACDLPHRLALEDRPLRMHRTRSSTIIAA